MVQVCPSYRQVKRSYREVRGRASGRELLQLCSLMKNASCTWARETETTGLRSLSKLLHQALPEVLIVTFP